MVFMIFFLYALICPDFLAISTFSGQCDFITSETAKSSAKSSGLHRSLAAWKMTPCATKNTEYQMEIQPFLVFLFTCLSFLLFLFYSIAFMLFCFWTCFWQIPALWLEPMLCLDCSGIVLLWLQQDVLVHSAVVVKVSLLRLWFLLLVIRTKKDRGGVQPTRSDCGRDPAPVMPCVGVDVPAWVNTSRPNYGALYGLEVMVSWAFDHRHIWDADVPFIWN